MLPKRQATPEQTWKETSFSSSSRTDAQNKEVTPLFGGGYGVPLFELLSMYFCRWSESTVLLRKSFGSAPASFHILQRDDRSVWQKKKKKPSCIWLITLWGSAFHCFMALTAMLLSLYQAEICLPVNSGPLRHRASLCASRSTWKPLQMGRRCHSGRLFSGPVTVSVFNWSANGLSADLSPPWSLPVVALWLLSALHAMWYPELSARFRVWSEQHREGDLLQRHHSSVVKEQMYFFFKRHMTRGIEPIFYKNGKGKVTFKSCIKLKKNPNQKKKRHMT